MHNNFQYLRRHFVQTLLVQQPLDGHGCHIVATRLNTPYTGGDEFCSKKSRLFSFSWSFEVCRACGGCSCSHEALTGNEKRNNENYLCLPIWWHLLRIGLSPCLRGKFMSIWWIWWIEAKLRCFDSSCNKLLPRTVEGYAWIRLVAAPCPHRKLS